MVFGHADDGLSALLMRDALHVKGQCQVSRLKKCPLAISFPLTLQKNSIRCRLHRDDFRIIDVSIIRYPNPEQEQDVRYPNSNPSPTL